MSYVVYVRVTGSNKGAHQYVVIDGIKIGEIWRQQVSQSTSFGTRGLKWRWFAVSYRRLGLPSVPFELSSDGYGTKDKAIDALESVV
jgi:hypothetical protein